MELPYRLVGCAGCRYLDPSVPGCVYILLTGHPRPSKPNPHGGCLSKDTKELDKTVPLFFEPSELPPQDKKSVGRPPLPGTSLLGDPTAEKMYASGASDAAIAKACRTSKNKVFRWRQATGRPSNQKRKVFEE